MRKNLGKYDELYKDVENLWGDSPGRLIPRFLNMYKSSPGRALDLGCGDGKNAVYLAERGWQVHCIDVSEQALRRLRQRFSGLGKELSGPIQRADVGRHFDLGYKFELVVSYGVAHCLPDNAALQLIDNIKRHLMPGGFLCFASFNDKLPVPIEHPTGELHLRPHDAIVGLLSPLEIQYVEIGDIQEDHLPAMGMHRHSLSWVIAQDAN